MYCRWHELLQFDPTAEQISLTSGRFVSFPDTVPESIPLDIIPRLSEYALVVGSRDGTDRFALLKPDGSVLKPKGQTRSVSVWANGKSYHFNVVKLLASALLKEDVTDNEYGIFIDRTGLYIESREDRLRLVETLKPLCKDLERVDLSIIYRSRSSDLDVTGKGYFVDGGVLYRKNGRVAVHKNGHVFLTDCDGKRQTVHIGRVMFNAYPNFYRFNPEYHVQVDHINGISTDNMAWNFRPVTSHQNMMVSHQTGTRIDRPREDSSHEKFKCETGPLTPEKISDFLRRGKLQRFENSSYWVHEHGAVIRQTRSGLFTYATLKVERSGYSYARRYCVHKMMMKAFGKYEDGKVVMHLNDDKQDNRLSNLKMGTSADNAWRKNAVIIYRPGEDPQTFVSEREAARSIGISQQSILWNRRLSRNHSESLVYSTTRSGIVFAVKPLAR